MKSQKTLIKNKVPVTESNYKVVTFSSGKLIYRMKKKFILNSVNLETDDEITVTWYTNFYTCVYDRYYYLVTGTNKFISNFEMETSMFKFVVEKHPEVFDLIYEKIGYDEDVR